MYEFSHQSYLELSERLMGAIRGRDYFSGYVCCVVDDVECRLICTLIIERTQCDEEYQSERVSKLIPIWWECRTTIGGEEIANDFSFREFLDVALA